MRSPCTIVKNDGQLYIAQPEGYPDLPDRISLIGTDVIIEPANITKEIDYGKLDENNADIAIRFLQFQLDRFLGNNPYLWRPSAGLPYLQKDPDPTFRSYDITLYRGFKLRLLQLPNNKIGVCIDITRKYASKHYLPAKITPNEFRKYKGRNCIYEFGHRWYEIKIDSICGLNANEELMADGSSLFDYIHKETKTPKPQSLLMLPKECTVLTYKTKLGIIKRVPSALCRLTYATDHPSVRNYHSRTIMPPYKRRKEIEFVVRKYLSRWVFSGNPIKLSDRMLEIDCEYLTPPDLEFGGGKILSFRDNVNAVRTTLEEFGILKRRMLYSSDAGFYVKRSALDSQYLVMPKSMYDTYGGKYLDDIKNQFRSMYSSNGGILYDPMVIVYNDSVRQSIPVLGNEIIQSVMDAVSKIFFYAGYGLVIIPRLTPERQDKEDELANLLMCEFRKRGIHVSISHTEIPSMSYIPIQLENGKTVYKRSEEERLAKRFRGYLENVVLNKILLLNRCWPFVLSTPLNSDLIIGLDVKNNAVGLMLIFKDGRTYSFTTNDSDEKEKLSREHASSLIYKYLRKELENEPICKDITIHRDGILYPDEIRGIKEALERLKTDGLLDKDYNCNFIEIKKTSRVPLRFFDTITPQGYMQERTENPKIGVYKIFGNTAFLCTTGRPFRYRGTTKPLQITKVEGNLPFKLIIEDIFALANLTWTKPDYCSRLPISIKMVDIRLREIAGGYSEDRLKFSLEGED
jgi:hypothetical protein